MGKFDMLAWYCVTQKFHRERLQNLCAFPGLGILRPAKPRPARVSWVWPDLLRCRVTRVTARSAGRAALDHVGPEVTCATVVLRFNV